jgi:transposase
MSKLVLDVRDARSAACSRVKDRPVVTLVDLAAFGRPTRLVWHKFRWHRAEPTCPGGSWTEDEPSIAAKRLMRSDRAGRWVTEPVGRQARTVNEIAVELGCDWHTINDTVVAYGTALVEHKDRFGTVEALGLDEVLFARIGPWHRQEFSTQIVDVNAGQPLDVVPGRSGDKPNEWLEAKGKEWRDDVRWATLDRRLLTKADERIDERGKEKLLGLLRAGDPRGEVTTTWHAKEAVRELYTHTDAELALEWLGRLCDDMVDTENPDRGTVSRPDPHAMEAPDRRLAHRSRHQRSHRSSQQLGQAGQGAAFGFTSFRNYRIRSLLYAGKPDWALLATIKPR